MVTSGMSYAVHYELGGGRGQNSVLQDFSKMRIEAHREQPVLYVAMATWIPKCNMYHQNNSEPVDCHQQETQSSPIEHSRKSVDYICKEDTSRTTEIRGDTETTDVLVPQNKDTTIKEHEGKVDDDCHEEKPSATQECSKNENSLCKKSVTIEKKEIKCKDDEVITVMDMSDDDKDEKSLESSIIILNDSHDGLEDNKETSTRKSNQIKNVVKGRKKKRKKKRRKWKKKNESNRKKIKKKEEKQKELEQKRKEKELKEEQKKKERDEKEELKRKEREEKEQKRKEKEEQKRKEREEKLKKQLEIEEKK
ncbi:hypothetical protein NQ314_002020 [Rhamnusium bicolor]|uniref:Uncharacterized protein n=1 Tax=Rhamnusium bicolor TaxID=1586634 RepID=A0AAV8ZQP4_9CUCU|nr:hypothetical protein NQ314_002020 [Rhamnusium bicolor]